MLYNRNASLEKELAVNKKKKEILKMKTKMMKKLISAVCAAAMATSCTVMSVGAVPPKGQTEQEEIIVNWGQEREVLKGFIETAKQIKDTGFAVNDCNVLANDVENFLNGAACHKITEDTNDELGQLAIFGGFTLHVDQLRSDDLEVRKNGIQGIIDFIPMIIELIQGRYLNN